MASFFDEIAKNNIKSMLVLGLFAVFFMFIIFILAIVFGLGMFWILIGFIAVIIYAIFTYYKGDKIVLAASGAKLADEKEYKNLYSVVEGLSLATQIKKPQIYIINDPNPNAFATGRRNKPSIAVTTGLLNIMNKNELEGVIAHEISHLADNDVKVMTIAIAFGGIIGILAIFLRSMIFFGGENRNGGGMLLIIAIVIGILAPIVAMLLRLAVSRGREYMADANGARITRDPHSLASALRKIENYNAKPNSKSIEKAGDVTASMYFSNPLKKGSISNLFSTHPPIDERIKKLENMY